MLETVVLAVLEGLASALGERLLGCGGTVSSEEIREDLDRLLQEHRQLLDESVGLSERVDSLEVSLLSELRSLIDRTESLTLDDTGVRFDPSPSAPTLGDALLNLDGEIEAVRRRAPSAPEDPPLARRFDSLEGLDEEIAARRSGSRG